MHVVGSKNDAMVFDLTKIIMVHIFFFVLPSVDPICESYGCNGCDFADRKQNKTFV